MLKKLVKHGNSNALILDRSILALLNINESAVLKLRIEGDTLLVRAAEPVKLTDSMMLDLETLHAQAENTPSSKAICESSEARFRESLKKAEVDPAKMKDLKEWEPGTENSDKMQEVIGKIMEKYKPEIHEKLGRESFKNDVEALTEQLQGDTTSEEFHNGLLALRLKHAPKLAEMDKEMSEALLALGVPSST